MKMKLHAEFIFIWKVSHLNTFWNRATLGWENSEMAYSGSDQSARRSSLSAGYVA